MRTNYAAFTILAASILLLSACGPAAPVPVASPAAARVTATAAPQATAAATTAPAAEPKPAPAAPAPTPKAAAEEPRYGGTLTISASADPAHFDIHQEGNLAILEVLISAYDSLIQTDLRTGNVAPDLAERWETSPDGLAYAFYLRKGVKFHDGKPLTAADVRYNLERQKDPPKGIRSGRQEQFDSVARIETPDENTVRIVMKQPYPAFMPQFATDWFIIYPKHVVEAKGDMKRDVVGTGPFKLKSYTSGVSVELVKNPDYFMKGLPYLDAITHYIIKDGATRFSAFRTGRVKMTGHWASLTPSEAAIAKTANPSLLIWKFPGLQAPRYPINAKNPPFNDVRLRQVVSLAYDRQAAIRVLAENEAKLGTFIPPGPWGLPEEEILKLPGYRQPKDTDRAEAKKLLAEAGYPDGFKMTLLVRALRPDQKAGEYMKDQLATVGINAAIQVEETAVFNTHTRSFSFQIASQQNIWRVNDPDELSRKFVTNAVQNYGGWSSKKFDELFVEQSRTLDVNRRKALTRELDKILLQEWPDLSPFWADTILGTWPEVKNFAAPPGLYTGMRNADIWLAK
ncbi:MAG: ABC transporter substrate-binding protein [Chloroflexi bacterium]|nr:ABC transporter substrate-binding protein [Chloroflexota bacterium]